MVVRKEVRDSGQIGEVRLLTDDSGFLVVGSVSELPRKTTRDSATQTLRSYIL